MNYKNFFKEFSKIENALLKIAKGFDKRQGFLGLLKFLHSKNLLSAETLADLTFIWQTRNKILNSPTRSIEITEEIFNKLDEIKSRLRL